MSERLIVSRHPAAIAFIRRESPDFADAPAMAIATADDVAGRIVAGNLPLHLAAMAREIIAVEFDGDAPRGQEYGLAEMDAAGAHLARYVVMPAAEATDLWRRAARAEESLRLAEAVTLGQARPAGWHEAGGAGFGASFA